ncbi:MAG: hypothetical protein GTO45_25315 [Candidatus Aminicenantes bacterium]|nr:hypothetical protein [Candidatus Aminicenantes bacterium]NIM82063.1 hypothetical protein [Candidatus Aminicenantes bacterium]NIN21461.1 hypothetical protein [Candidatus Aminicenantes bacterium]NIN45273.1 hypothetical protein [Candidatus Aminicenantes bacterium]NIN88090.1 hypothetical protein [Candidatus Aminicenantes bacterium]
MKTKMFGKRLVLKKKTVAHLNKKEMKGLHGGIGNTRPTLCDQMTCYRTCYC